MSNAIGDSSAISFSTSFYQAVGYGRNIKEAYELGCAQVDLENLSGSNIPQLIAKRIKPEDIAFAGRI
jgi:hypothetical protein